MDTKTYKLRNREGVFHKRKYENVERELNGRVGRLVKLYINEEFRLNFFFSEENSKGLKEPLLLYKPIRDET